MKKLIASIPMPLSGLFGMREMGDSLKGFSSIFPVLVLVGSRTGILFNGYPLLLGNLMPHSVFHYNFRFSSALKSLAYKVGTPTMPLDVFHYLKGCYSRGHALAVVLLSC